LSGRRVLLIEDNEQNRYLVTYLLEHHGYEVVSAGDGARGIEIARETNPTLILLDIQLPTMDGYAVAEALRADERLRDVPIVAVTSHAMAGDEARALAAGCTAYIEKPIDPVTFVAEMEAVLKDSEAPGMEHTDEGLVDGVAPRRSNPRGER
jgi:two-component system, cell cycle response regulator DivK